MTPRVLLALAALAVAPAARADIFSPGPLSNPHASLEGLSNCTKCHPQGQQLSQATCLECHTELKGRVAAGSGFHGHLQGKARDCWTCHHEHQGRAFALVDWGAGGQKGFDHAKTGTPLKGKHAPLACEKCHDRKLIQDQAVRTLLEKQPTRKTFLGAPVACNACHFDEHRGQEGTDCQKCHDERGFKPPHGFDHAKTNFALLGKHQKVACEKCHAKAEDVVEHVGALQPRARTFLRFKPLPHGSCQDCHKDPHQGRFGESCQKCHTEVDWKTIAGGGTKERAFHDRARYKLEGAHLTVKCGACHGPFPGTPAQYHEMSFQACTDCHLDAHEGQMRRARADGNRCDRCHTVAGFDQTKFTQEDHQQTRYPLEGAHRNVACASCHPSDPRLAEHVPAAAKEELARRGRPVKVSLGVYAIAGDLRRCETCHADPHGGQFDKRAGEKGCVACHEISTFAKTKFDHAKDTKFPLFGKHAKTTCASCHPTQRNGRGAPVVKYAGIETTCAGCHADPHGAQFARAPGAPTDCARCHSNEAWKKPLLFLHQPPFTEFKLSGKHLKVECKSCHAEVRVGEAKVARYKGVPRTCQGCHVDFHKGAFKGFEP